MYHLTLVGAAHMILSFRLKDENLHNKSCIAKAEEQDSLIEHKLRESKLAPLKSTVNPTTTLDIPVLASSITGCCLIAAVV